MAAERYQPQVGKDEGAKRYPAAERGGVRCRQHHGEEHIARRRTVPLTLSERVLTQGRAAPHIIIQSCARRRLGSLAVALQSGRDGWTRRLSCAPAWRSCPVMQQAHAAFPAPPPLEHTAPSPVGSQACRQRSSKPCVGAPVAAHKAPVIARLTERPDCHTENKINLPAHTHTPARPLGEVTLCMQLISGDHASAGMCPLSI